MTKVGPKDREKANVTSVFRARHPQTGQPHLDPQEDDGEKSPGDPGRTEGVWDQSADLQRRNHA